MTHPTQTQAERLAYAIERSQPSLTMTMVAAELRRLSAENEQLRKTGPEMSRGTNGNGDPWMGTMLDCLNDARAAATAEAQYADELRTMVAQLEAERVTLTDEEIRRNWSGGACPDWGIKFARAIIAALRAKSGGV